MTGSPPGPRPRPARLRRALACLAAAALARPAAATWSVVVVDDGTGEVCIAAATCLLGLDLRDTLAVVRVGEGAAAAQSFIDSTGANRKTIWDGFAAGLEPAEILAALAASDSQHLTRQYGIVRAGAPPAVFTGSDAGTAKGALFGQSGTLRYAIQGNVLTGKLVLARARDALLATPGDLSQRVMAAMEAARALGGDGRCSCNVNHPTSCGVPPPSFKTSALIGFLVVARPGDADGVCTQALGCANGSYYAALDVKGKPNVDAVDDLRAQYDAWRAALSGRPDHFRSRLRADAAALPADGLAQARVVVELADVDGLPLGRGGALLRVERADGAAPLTAVGPVTDRGDGTYAFTVTAGARAGLERLVVAADDGLAPVTLHPPLELRLDPPAPLHVGRDAVSASTEVSVPFVIDAGPQAAGAAYWLLASAAGTAPGTAFAGVVVPLNPDGVYLYTLAHPGPPNLPGSRGLLDGAGRATARLVARPDVLAPVAGLHLDWAAVVPARAFATNAVGLDVAP